MEFDEEIRDFLIESSENLANLDRQLVELEQNPEDMRLISSVFRTIHTIKGTSGFFGYDILGAVTHVAENILDQVRQSERRLTPGLISLILEVVDAVKALLQNIEATGSEGEDGTALLRSRLEAAYRACDAPAPKAEAGPVAADVALQAAVQAEDVVAPRLELVADAPSSTSSRVPMPETIREVAPPEVSSNENDGTKDAGRETHLADSTIRVDVGLLNRLMNMVGELVLARNQLLQDAPAQSPSLQKTSQRLNLITSELQEGLMKTRMQPVGVVWNKLPRVVRDLAAKCGKKIQIEMDGAATELDKTIIEAIKDPLTHIVRNSCDHGIELPEVRLSKHKNPEGTLLLRAFHEGGVVNLEISDDGAGIDPEKLKAKAIEKGLIRAEQAAQMSARDALHLIFMPGFSTAAQVTSISGRGVGMDVVKTNIEKIGGNVEVMNRAEGGTTIRIKIPLTLAIIPGLVVTLNGTQDATADPATPSSRREERFIIPQANLLELVRIEGIEEMKRIENVHSTPVFHHRGKLLPLIYLSQVLHRIDCGRSAAVVNIVVVQTEHRQIGLVVDRIWDTQEIVVKPLGRQLKGLTCYVGATIMGDGRPALILDVAGLSRLAGVGLQARPGTTLEAVSSARDTQQTQMILLFRAGSHDRLAVPLALVDRLEEVATSKIESASGSPVLHYRGSILPLIMLAQVLEPNAEHPLLDRESCQVVVFSDGPRRMGLLVDQIVDIVSDTIAVRRKSSLPGLLGSAVIGGKISDVIDLHELVQQTGENWLDPVQTKEGERPSLLLLDNATVAREMMAEFLYMAGFDVMQAGSCLEAQGKVRQTPVDVVIAGSEIMNKEGQNLLEGIRRDRKPQSVPLIGLVDRADQIRPALAGAVSCAMQVVRSDRNSLLRSVCTLTQTDDEQAAGTLTDGLHADNMHANTMQREAA